MSSPHEWNKLLLPHINPFEPQHVQQHSFLEKKVKYKKVKICATLQWGAQNIWLGYKVGKHIFDCSYLLSGCFTVAALILICHRWLQRKNSKMLSVCDNVFALLALSVCVCWAQIFSQNTAIFGQSLPEPHPTGSLLFCGESKWSQ